MSTCALGHALAEGETRCSVCGLGRLPTAPTAQPEAPTAPTPPAQSGEPSIESMAPAPAQSVPVLSPDGQWLWNGAEWVPTPPAHSPPPAPAPVPAPMVSTAHDARPRGRALPRLSAKVLAGLAMLVVLMAVGIVIATGRGTAPINAAPAADGAPNDSSDTSTEPSGPQLDSNGQPVPDGFPVYPDGEVPPASCVTDNPGQHWLCESASKGFVGPQFAALIRQTCNRMAFIDFPLNITQEPDGQGGGFIEQVTLLSGDSPTDFYEQLTVVGGSTSYRNAYFLRQFAFLTRSPADPKRYLTVGCGVTNGSGAGTRTYSRAEVDQVAFALAQPAPTYAPYTPGPDGYPKATSEDVAICHSRARLDQMDADAYALYRKTKSLASIKATYAQAPRILQALIDLADALTRSDGDSESDGIITACPNLQ